jgi:hypothetical protein
MKLTYKSSKLTYKALFGYSLVIITLLVIAVPVFANTSPGTKFLDFSFEATVGNSPQNARTLSHGVNLNHLNPGEENWYVYGRDSLEIPDLSWISLALRYESEAIIDTDEVNFQIFVQKRAGWFQKSETPEEILGVGSRSPLRATDRNLTEAFWTGRVAHDELYYVRVFNNSPFGLDYVLEAKKEQPAVSGATPASFNSALGNTETLNARQLAWTLTAQAVENMTADQAATWMQKAQAVGWIVTEGTLASNVPIPGEADPKTLWALTAQAIEGQDAEIATQWLIQADSMGWLSIPLGTLKDPNPILSEESIGGDGDGADEPPAEPVQPDEIEAYIPVNIYPNNPLDFNLSEVNSGRLAPYGEHWYSLTRDDFDTDLIEDLALTMFFTPRMGYLDNRINFELFPASQYHIWARGDADYMEHFGTGMWISRDDDPNTGEQLWSGSLVDGDSYFIKVKNGTSEVIDYYLFPADVENAELGNPTLHQGISSEGRVPYAPSPPTRPGPPPAPGTGPPEAIPLEIGTTKGTLEAGQEIWYRFFYRDPYNEDTPQHDFTFYLTNTPLDSIRARHADFEIYPAGQIHLWTRGTTDELEPLGASAPSPYETEDVRSLQVLWTGQLMEEHAYYIKVYSHDIGPLEYEFEIKGGP